MRKKMMDALAGESLVLATEEVLMRRWACSEVVKIDEKRRIVKQDFARFSCVFFVKSTNIYAQSSGLNVRHSLRVMY
jgi:hypothetical protein